MADKTDLNRAHFDEHAKTYNSRFQKTIDQLIVQIQKRREWIGVDWVEEDNEHTSSSSPKKTVRLLDYACGTGLVTRALLPYITTSIGIDLSPNMVTEFNTLASNQGLAESEMHAYVGNLMSSSDDAESDFLDEKFFDFDIVVVGLGFHHFNDPKLAAKKLAKRLRKGGVLMIIDFLPHGVEGAHGHDHGSDSGHGHGHSHSHGHGHSHHDSQKDENVDVIDEKEATSAQHTVSHHGFTIADVKTMFEDAGVGKGFEAVEMGDGVVFARKDGEETRRDFKRSVFIARGFKE